MRVFLISDTHFKDQFLERNELRPKGVTEKIIKNWNQFVNPDDVIIHLGDIVIGNSKDYTAIIPRLNGRKILVVGNHDKKGISWYMKNGFDFVCNAFSWQYTGKSILFTHEPSSSLEIYDLNIHGHLHLGIHRTEYKLTDKHLLFSLETENYQPVLLNTFIEKRVRR